MPFAPSLSAERSRRECATTGKNVTNRKKRRCKNVAKGGKNGHFLYSRPSPFKKSRQIEKGAATRPFWKRKFYFFFIFIAGKSLKVHFLSEFRATFSVKDLLFSISNLVLLLHTRIYTHKGEEEEGDIKEIQSRYFPGVIFRAPPYRSRCRCLHEKSHRSRGGERAGG